MSAGPEVADEVVVAAEQDRTYTVYVDFDGVVHSYASGWQGVDVIPDPPVVDVVTGQSSIEWLNEVTTVYEVVIHTTRARYPEGVAAIYEWLRGHGFKGACVVSAEKGPGLMYVDDRGWRFAGRFPTLKQIRHQKPWRTGDPERRTAKHALDARKRDLGHLEQRQAKLKAECRSLRRMVLLEVLTGRGLTEEDADGWLAARDQKELFEARLVAARAEPVR